MTGTRAMMPGREIARLLEIMAALRAPVTGCPWDLEQDFSTIAPYTIEEAYEVADAIRQGDMLELRDELGDLLLQVVFHARMAEEKGSFAFPDVVEAITSKMIRRHPHVFGDGTADDPAKVKATWEEIKSAERAQKLAEREALGLTAGQDSKGHLDTVPISLPALTRALKLQERAARVGFDWKETGPVIEKIAEEIGELREAVETGDLAHARAEFGDVLFALVNLGRHLGIDSEEALSTTNAKFTRRFHAVETALTGSGRSLEAASLDEMETLWQAAKKDEPRG